VRAASRAGSDHTLLVIDFGLEVGHKLPPFRFEKWWLEKEISMSWSRRCGIPCVVNMTLWRFGILKPDSFGRS